MKRIKQYGLQRSGTNYTKFLLDRNYDVDVLTERGGQKHGHYALDASGLEVDAVVVTVKNPFAWLVSMFNFLNSLASERYRHPEDWDDFLCGEFLSPQPSSVLFFDNPAECWSKMNRHWLSIYDPSVSVVVITRYEDLLASPEEETNRIATMVGLERRAAPFEVPTMQLAHYLRKNETQDWPAFQTKDKFARKTYYLNEEYAAHFSDTHLRFVGGYLNSALLGALGYREAL